MKSKMIYLTAVFLTALLLFSIIGVIAATDQIRPAPQTDSRGDGEQIRPANQQNLPSDGNGGYSPSEGSSYSSKIRSHVTTNVNLNAVLNNTDLNTTSNATGNASLTLDTATNELSYDITYSGLSSNETAAELDVPGLIVENQTVSYQLSLGEVKQGIISLANDVKDYILSGGNALIKIKSLLFPEGEVSGYIKII
jgi:hypothetical protein